MAAASNTLVILHQALLPHLRGKPTDAVPLDLLQICAASLIDDGMAAGGSFYGAVVPFVGGLNQYLVDAHNSVNGGALIEAIDNLIVNVKKLLDATHTLKDMEAVAAVAAAPEGVGVAIQTDSLQHHLSLLMKSAGAAPPHPVLFLLARQVRVREADAFIHLAAVLFPGAEEPGPIVNLEALKSTAEASKVLIILHGALLPHLLRNPTDGAALIMLSVCAHKIKECSKVAGGSFERKAAALRELIYTYVQQARNHIRYSPHDPLQEMIDNIMRKVDVLLNTSCTISHGEPLAAAVAADAEVQV